jgi:undecaprenyl-diphosphatase
MGALASAAGLLPKTPRRLLRTVAIALSLTRIAVLAHWASDVVAVFALGAATERLLRPWTLTQSFRKRISWRKRP